MTSSARARLSRSAPTRSQPTLDRTSPGGTARRETARRALIASSTSPQAAAGRLQEQFETAQALLIL
jgi:hypothetical protein